MSESSDIESMDTPVSIQPSVRISVSDFGPITSGTIDLRPLTIFVGPSNTGKTYFALLIYALHRVLDGFPRLPIVHRVADDIAQEERLNILEKLEIAGQPFRFSDLPESIRNVAQVALNDPEWLRAELETEIRRCFDPESVSNLIRFSGDPDDMKVLLAVSEGDRELWHFRVGISESGMTGDGHIEDMVLLPEGWPVSELQSERRFRRPGSRGDRWPLLQRILLTTGSGSRGETHYLPAARSGIMQSHRIIASSVMRRATRAGLERFAELPTFSGVIVDFMDRLIHYEGDRSDNMFAHLIDRGFILMSKIADALEQEMLAGQIRVKRPSGEYPEFVYRPLGKEEDIRLTRASSMVSELAPVVLFLRGAVNRGDMFIIEEPEAHLHPAAQTRMAVALARLVRAGVRVVVTTHSDWLLQEIGNLIREGELEEQTGEPASEGFLPSSLRPSEVGVWLFRRDRDSAGSVVKEIKFDRSEGVEPEEYEDVAEELYNRSASLQNQLEEIAGEPERDDD